MTFQKSAWDDRAMHEYWNCGLTGRLWAQPLELSMWSFHVLPIISSAQETLIRIHEIHELFVFLSVLFASRNF